MFITAASDKPPTLAAKRVLTYELEKPVPPSPDACCGNGCRVCVYDKYAEAMEQYEAQEERKRQQAGTGDSPNASGDYAQLVSAMISAETPASANLLPSLAASTGMTSGFACRM